MAKKSKRVLIVAAHPDDEILGCGGTAARLVKEGCEVHTLILGEGVTSRDAKRDRAKREKEIKALKKQAREANKKVGISKVVLGDLPDNRFDTVPMLDIVKTVEGVKREFRPDVVYTHFWGDLNVDHRITYNAVLTACRPIKGETVKEIYSFEVPSSTDWNHPDEFQPDTFVDITGTLDAKIKALKCYGTEIKDFPHPRSVEALRSSAKKRGSSAGIASAEAFKAVRVVR